MTLRKGGGGVAKGASQNMVPLRTPGRYGDYGYTAFQGVHSSTLLVETAVCSDIVRGGAKGAV